MALGTIPSTAKIALNFVRSRAPAGTDDGSAGYAIGTCWTDQTTQKMYLCMSDATGGAVWTEITATAPPAPGTLTWAPPGYPNFTGYQQRTISNTSRSHVVNPLTLPRVDAVFTIAEPITAGDVLIQGFNNIVIIGGELVRGGTPGQNNVALKLYQNDGVCHIEGLWIHDSGNGSLVDCIVLSTGRTLASGQPGMTLRLQNCHLRNGFDNSGLHADNVQLWTIGTGWPSTYIGGCGDMQFDRVTGYSLRQSLELEMKSASNYLQALGNCDFRRCNFEHIPGSTLGNIGAHIILKEFRSDATCRPSTMTLQDFWIWDGFSGYGKQNWFVPDASGGYDGGPNVTHCSVFYPDPTRANSLLTDAQGQYLTWPGGADVVGQCRLGRPPAGDFVPLGVAGMDYTSPGYQS